MDEFLATDLISDPAKAGLGGLAVGLLFGFLAQRSGFCLRSACIEFWRGSLNEKFLIWLSCFGTALLLTQLLFRVGILSEPEIRQISSIGTLSGAMIGGAMFGIGMILARGCASRLLVLSGTGNLRALVAGLVVTVVAQASLTGILSPLQQSLSGLWTIGPDLREMGQWLPDGMGMLLGTACLLTIVGAAILFRADWRKLLAAAGVGGAVSLGWAFTATLAGISFDPVPVGSVTFTGPSADTLMALITVPQIVPTFSIGLVPGVFAGACLAALLSGTFKIQTFDQTTGMTRYLVGAALMGFGGMLAGGCAVGAGVTGGSVLSLTAWVALFCMWAGAGAALALTRRPGRSPAPSSPQT